MATKGLTQATIARAKPADRPYELRDGGPRGAPGLLLRVQPSGRKTYYVQLGRGRRERIGTADGLTLGRARVLATKLRGEAEPAGDAPARPSATLGDYLSDYRRWYKLHHRNERSLDNLAAWRPLHDLRLDEIDATRVKAMLTERLQAGVKPSTINRNLGALRALLQHAVDEGYLETHPLTAVKPLKVEEPHRVRYLSPDEEKRLLAALERREARIRRERASANRWRAKRGYELLPDLDAAPFADHLRPAVLLSMHTGVRWGELRRLRWADVTDEAIYVAPGKSGRGRNVPLSKTARATLEGWRESPGCGSVYVFEGRHGGPLDNVRKAWAGVLDDAGTSGFTWHDLRHHFASTLAMKGVPLATIQRLLGHSSIRMTERYAHLSPNALASAVQVLDIV